MSRLNGNIWCRTLFWWKWIQKRYIYIYFCFYNYIKFCSNSRLPYFRPVDLFLKHQQVKSQCLSEFSNLNSEYFDELGVEYKKTSERIDLVLQDIDKENSSRRSTVLNKIKQNSLEKYKNHMDSCVKYTFFPPLLNSDAYFFRTSKFFFLIFR